MSSTVFANPNPSPAVTRRPPISNGDSGNRSQRSLSSKLRNLFRKKSPSPNRTTTNDGRPPPAPVRQRSPSPRSGKSPTDAPHLQAPTVSWPFGKKKTKSPNTPTKKKKKNKDNRKTNQAIVVPPMEISRPFYEQENQTSIRGQNFVPRTPEFAQYDNGRLQSSSSYDATTAKGFRDYVVIDHSQQYQPVVPEVDDFTSQRYITDRSRSPSMNRQPLSNTNIEYYYQNRDSSPPVAIPLPDVDVYPTPERKRKVGDIPSLPPTQIRAENSPMFSHNPSRSPLTIQSPTVSSYSLNNPGIRPTTSLGKDVDVPKLKTPLIPFSSASSKKKTKRTKLQSHPNGLSGSSTTINNLVQLNPVTPNRSWANTYGSLPDAEMIYDSSLTSLRPTKPNANKYPWISAIVQHHMRPGAVYYNERSPPPPPRTTTPTTFRRPQRFETSTATPNEHDHPRQWSNHSINRSPSPSPTNHRHDAYIRPFTPQKPSVQPDIGIIRVDNDHFHRRSPSPPLRPSRHDSPTIYRSSTTIYAEDKRRFVDGGEIRTWTSRENGNNDDHMNTYIEPHIHIHIDRQREEPATDHYHHHAIPLKVDEYRYSPRAQENDRYENQHKIKEIDHEQGFGDEEERYEVSYEYEHQQEQYSYEARQNYDQSPSTNRYSEDITNDPHMVYLNHPSAAHASNLIGREKIYDQSSRSYLDSERMQEPLNTLAPVRNAELILRTYTLRRSDSYDGLGICIAADAETNLNHIIREVEPGSPGDRAGLRNNDRIISINNVNVENVDFNNVLILIKQGLDNDNLQLSVIHELDHI